MRERWQTSEISWKKTQYLMNTLYIIKVLPAAFWHQIGGKERDREEEEQDGGKWSVIEMPQQILVIHLCSTFVLSHSFFVHRSVPHPVPSLRFLVFYFYFLINPLLFLPSPPDKSITFDFLALPSSLTHLFSSHLPEPLSSSHPSQSPSNLPISTFPSLASLFWTFKDISVMNRTTKII